MELFVIAIIMGIIEGITEFLPISSTGHLIVVEHFLKLPEGFDVVFSIVIQLGATLAVILYFRDKLFHFGPHSTPEERDKALDTWKKTIIGVLPAILIGGTVGSKIDDLLFNPYVVAVALIVGGILLVIIEMHQRPGNIKSIASMTYTTAFQIGIIQCLAMIPGTSRSASTIIGAMLLGCSRVVAAEYSFFLAIPTMLAASAYVLLFGGVTLSGTRWGLLAAGFMTAFLVAWVAIAFMMNYIKKKDFQLFGYYRIGLGIVVLAYFAFLAF